ncbi:hypothetical protein TNCT_86391 [Trichonephila clavata]|uniref:Uncharacterized protein n=1 Tax=Trichonephila clavata TaxID=2740835 RepID=A0A8X6M2P0_TRICU|nr:hypothetical protein TNCT_86391 [Trichonephila clavata]
MSFVTLQNSKLSIRIIKRRLEAARLNGRSPVKIPMISTKIPKALVSVPSTRLRPGNIKVEMRLQFCIGLLRKIWEIMDKLQYEEIREDTMRSYAHSLLGWGFIFPLDNDPRHQPKLVQNWFSSYHVILLV